jgi:hypothetical protein
LTAYYGRDTLGGGVFRTSAPVSGPVRGVRVQRDERNRVVLTSGAEKPRAR